MSLLDEARALQKRQGGSCSIKDFLPDAELEEALEAVRNKLQDIDGPKVDAVAVTRALANRKPPVKIPAANLRRHARGECECRVAA